MFSISNIVLEYFMSRKLYEFTRRKSGARCTAGLEFRLEMKGFQRVLGRWLSGFFTVTFLVGGAHVGFRGRGSLVCTSWIFQWICCSYACTLVFTSPQLLVIWLLAGDLRRSNALFSPDGAKLLRSIVELLWDFLAILKISKSFESDVRIFFENWKYVCVKHIKMINR